MWGGGFSSSTGAGALPPAWTATAPYSSSVTTPPGSAFGLPSLEFTAPRAIDASSPTYYRQRLDDFIARNPGIAPPDYYLSYGEKYQQKFTLLRPSLSRAGQAWVDRTRDALHAAIERERERDPAAFAALERDAAALRAFAFRTHAQAYLDSGFCHLGVSDVMKIILTPDPADLLNRLGLLQAGHVVEACTPEWIKFITADLALL